MGQQLDRVTLRIANKMEFMPLVMANTIAISEMLGFSEAIIKKMQIGIKEGVSYAIHYGFLPGELDWIDIVYDTSVLGLKITIQVKGVPLDVAKVEEEAKWKAIAEKDIVRPGFGLHTMKKCFDQVAFYNLGIKGQEIQLEKFFYRSRTKLKISSASKAKLIKPVANAEYIIRSLDMAEAGEVAKCAYSSYGYTYTYEHIYYPERIRGLNQTGKLISYVAITADTAREIIGHAALVKGKDYQSMELAAAFVKPAYRGKGCLNKLTAKMIEVARERNLECIYVSAVTSHNISQKAANHMGFRETALLLSRVPGIKMRNIKEDSICRESVLISTLYLQSVEHKPMYLPQHHQQMIKRIYQESGIMDAVWLTLDRYNIDQKNPVKNAAIYTYTDKYQASHIYVNHYGANVKKEVGGTLKKMCLKRMETVYLYLDLTVKDTAVMTKEFEDIGFFFAGIFPGRGGKDWLVLQYLNNQCIDYQQISTYSKLSKDLVQYVEKCDPYSWK